MRCREGSGADGRRGIKIPGRRAVSHAVGALPESESAVTPVSHGGVEMFGVDPPETVRPRM